MNKPYVIKKRRLFKPDSSAPFTISCTQIEAFVDCPRCFYINHRLGIRRSSSPPFTLNLLVDRMLNRGDRTPHPFVRAAKNSAIGALLNIDPVMLRLSVFAVDQPTITG